MTRAWGRHDRAASRPPQSDDPIEAITAILQVLARPLRLRIVLDILDRDATAAELADRLDVAYATLAQHLRHLRVAGLVHRHRAGNHVYYTATPPAAAVVRVILAEVLGTADGPAPVIRAQPRQ
ncbi:winged helix-turn-helix domain-containing protein [Dactylosporangium sp. NPDC005572]|uniref:ArsR/SmtB family transcription factor n=1 Tax=Dactylosporangium sp. NPDC005572 TaxID=3156889 RepID=UPI0033B9FD64